MARYSLSIRSAGKCVISKNIAWMIACWAGPVGLKDWNAKTVMHSDQKFLRTHFETEVAAWKSVKEVSRMSLGYAGEPNFVARGSGGRNDRFLDSQIDGVGNCFEWWS